MKARLRHLLRLLDTSAIRLSLRYALLQILVLAIAIAVLLWLADRYVTAQIEGGLVAEADTLAALPLSQIARRIETLADASGPRHYLMLDAHGQRLAGDVAHWPAGLAPDGRVRLIEAEVIDPEEAGETETLGLLARASVLPGGARLIVAQETAAAEDLRDYVLAASGVVLALSGLLSLLLGLTLGRQWLARIEAINRTAGAIAAGDLTQRVATQGRGDEFDLLAGHLNHMLARIEAAVAGMREVSDNVAHDLRKPLARLKTRIEVLLTQPRAVEEYRAALAQTAADADELMRTFDALLSIARLEAGGAIPAPQPFDLAEVARGVSELYAAEAEDSGRPFRVDSTGEARINGDARLVAQALANLLDNAFKYTAPQVPVEVRLLRQGPQWCLEVIDHGAGLDDPDKARLLKRFARGDAARSQPGSGLGLALAAAIARAHGGSLTLRDTPGGGLTAVLCLPVSPGS
jgi:signal transduction histidine kinase